MNRKVKILIIVLSTIAALAITVWFGGNLYVDSLLNKVNRKPEIEQEKASISEEVIEKVKAFDVTNIALFGVDNSGNKQGHERADATKIISLDHDNKQIKITSVQRDILIWLPDPIDDWNKLNHSYWYGGPELSVKTLNYNLDLDITQYVSFSFEALEEIVDLVDGVDIYLNSSEAATLGFNGQGTYRLYGRQALSFARIRNLDSDYGRMDRQNKVIEAIIRKVKSYDLIALLDLTNEILPYLETNISNEDIKSYMMAIMGFDISVIPQYQVPSGGYNDTNSKSYLGFSPMYLLRSYQDMAKEVHLNIYGVKDYEPSNNIIEYEKKTYAKFGDFVE